MPGQPHDKLFKWTFSQREHAAGLLRATLPAAWVAKADLRTLRLEHTAASSAARCEVATAIPCSRSGSGREIYFYVLVEQQREVQPLMIVRMGLYIMRLYDELLRDQPRLEVIPPILPLLVHHSAGGWTAATAFQNVVAIDDALRADLWRYIRTSRCA